MTETESAGPGSAVRPVVAARAERAAGGGRGSDALGSDAQPDPDAIAHAVLAQPGVAKLHGGAFGEVATYLPGRRVAGVQVGEQRVSVHVAVRLGSPVHGVAERVRVAVEPLTGGLPVDIVIEDVVDGTESDGNDDSGGDDRIGFG